MWHVEEVGLVGSGVVEKMLRDLVGVRRSVGPAARDRHGDLDCGDPSVNVGRGHVASGRKVGGQRSILLRREVKAIARSGYACADRLFGDEG